MPFKNPEKQQEYNKAYLESHREIANTRSKNYYASHKEDVSRKSKLYRELNKEDINKRRGTYSRARLSRKWDRRFGWELGTHERLLDTSKVCALCGESFGISRELKQATDHDHETGSFRGIIHWKCNLGIGHLQDSSTRCLQAAAYLQRGNQ